MTTYNQFNPKLALDAKNRKQPTTWDEIVKIYQNPELLAVNNPSAKVATNTGLTAPPEKMPVTPTQIAKKPINTNTIPTLSPQPTSVDGVYRTTSKKGNPLYSNIPMNANVQQAQAQAVPQLKQPTQQTAIPQASMNPTQQAMLQESTAPSIVNGQLVMPQLNSPQPAFGNESLANSIDRANQIIQSNLYGGGNLTLVKHAQNYLDSLGKQDLANMGNSQRSNELAQNDNQFMNTLAENRYKENMANWQALQDRKIKQPYLESEGVKNYAQAAYYLQAPQLKAPKDSWKLDDSGDYLYDQNTGNRKPYTEKAKLDDDYLLALKQAGNDEMQKAKIKANYQDMLNRLLGQENEAR